MAKILIINSNTDTFGRQSIPTTYIVALLKKNNHQVELFDTTFMDTSPLFPDKKPHEELNIKLNFFKRVDYSNYGLDKKKINIVSSFEDKIRTFQPDLITFSFWGSHLYAEGEFFSYFYGLEIIERADIGDIPVAVGGTVPTWYPEEALKHPKVKYVVKGEGELVFVDMADRIDKKESLSGIENLWIKEEDGTIESNPLRPLINPLDSLPFADYDMYDDRLFYRPYHGKMVRCVDAELSRGCIYNCTFCLSPFQREQYGLNTHQGGHPSKFRREKSIERIIKEISFLKERYSLDMIRYQDETFLTMNKDKLKDLSKEYKKYVDLPFIIEATINSISESKVDSLKTMGCLSISLGLESGNKWLRDNVLKKPRFTNEDAVRKAEIVKASGISFNLFNIIGFPQETKEMIFDTIELNRKIKPPYMQVSYFQPWEGTALREYSIENGLLDATSTGLENSQDTLTINQLKTPVPKDELKDLHNTFAYYVYLNKIFWPFIGLVSKKGPISKKVAKFLTYMVEKRFDN